MSPVSFLVTALTGFMELMFGIKVPEVNCIDNRISDYLLFSPIVLDAYILIIRVIFYLDYYCYYYGLKILFILKIFFLDGDMHNVFL